MNKLKIYLDKDINKDLIKSKKIAVIGFGSQGYGQSMNLKDSGCDVVLGLRLGGKSDNKAKKYGFKTMSIPEAVKYADIVQILIPDDIDNLVDGLWFELKTVDLDGEENTYHLQLEVIEITRANDNSPSAY